ncbi:MAG: polysaccharide deacetylase family protein [Firmicutes bacterium]|nr:polysaccharide deacetylase family protein [Bacillota bacterium]
MGASERSVPQKMTLFFVCFSIILLTGLVVFWISQYIRINFPTWFIIAGSLSVGAVIADFLGASSFYLYHSPSGLYFSIVLFLISLVSIDIFRYFYEHRGFGKGRTLMRRLSPKETAQNTETGSDNSETGKKHCLLTFDDGPSAQWTPGILKVLKDNNIYAIFFLVGNHIRQNPETAGMIEEYGCEAAVHSDSHKPLPFLFSSQLNAELKNNFEIIEKITRKRPEFFRPPWGLYNREVLEIAESLGLKTILWSRSSIDWKEKNSDKILSNALPDIKSGEIFLFHDGCKPGATRQATLESIPVFIQKLYELDFHFDSFYDIKN